MTILGITSIIGYILGIMVVVLGLYSDNGRWKLLCRIWGLGSKLLEGSYIGHSGTLFIETP